MKNTNHFLVLAVIATTLLCAALVWSNIVSLGRARELQEQLEAKATELQQLAASKHDPTTRSDTGLAEMLAQREAEYAKLREDYDKLQQQLTNATPVAVTSTNAAGQRFGRGNGGPNNPWMERLRLQDPERYKQMMAARDQRRQQVEQQYQEQMAALENRIQTAPTQEEVDLASQIATTLDKLGQLRQQMQQYANIPRDQLPPEAQDLLSQMRQASQTLRDLGNQDRAKQLQDLGSKLGVPDQAAQQLPDTIAKIYQDTNYRAQGGRGIGFGGDGGGNAGNTGGGSASSTPSTQPSSSSTTK